MKFTWSYGRKTGPGIPRSGVEASEQRALLWNRVYGDSYSSSSYSGKRVSEESALKYSVVWAAVNLITDSIATLQPGAFREQDDGTLGPEILPQWILRPGQSSAQRPGLSRTQIWSQMLLSLLLWGNAYVRLNRRSSDGQILSLSPLDPAGVYCEWEPGPDGQPNLISRRYRYQDGRGNITRWFNSYDIMHLQGATLPGQPTGLSVIAQARESIGLGLTLEEFGARYFSQGSMAKVAIMQRSPLDESQARNIVHIYEKFHKGPGNWHRPAVVGGDGEIKNISIPPNEAQFLETREFQATDIARWFRVPLHRLNIMTKVTSWGSGLAEENAALLQFTLAPWITRMEEAFTIYSPAGEGRGIRIILNTSELRRGTFKEQVDTWCSLHKEGIVTGNEVRKELNLPLSSDPKADELVDAAAASNPFGNDQQEESTSEDKEKDRERKQEEANA